MRRFGSHWMGLLLAVGLAAASTGCATFGAGHPSKQDEAKATSHLEIGTDHMVNGRTALALREFLAAEQLDSTNAKIQYALGEAFLARGKPKKSEQHLRRALELVPGYQDARLSLAAMLLMQSRYEEAIHECDVLSEDPTYPTPWRALTNRAWAEFNLGDRAKALETLELVGEYRRDYWPATLTRAMIESEGGRKLEAIRLYHDVLAQEPGPNVESEVNYRMGEIYASLGKRREALGHLTTSVARSPESLWARKSQEHLKKLH
jgi:Tfp pilus assembly protein PilF